MQQAVDELNYQLELKIEHHLNHARLRMPDPQESIIFAPNAYTPSILSAATIPDPAMATITKPASNCLRTTNVSTISTDTPTAMRPQFYALYHSHTIEMRVYLDLPIRIHTRRIHLELTHEWALVLATGTSVATTHSQASRADEIGLLVQVEYLSGDFFTSFSDLRHVYDLAVPLEAELIPPGILLSEAGLVLRKRDDIIILRVLQRR